MFRIILLTMLIVSLSACVGVGLYTDTQFRYSRSEFITEKNEKLKSKEQILTVLGEPTSKTMSLGQEVWTYAGRGDTAWRGAVIWVLLPIPLLIPVGDNDVQVVFKDDGTLLNLLDGEVDATFYGCNIGFVCGVFNDVTHPVL